ncbi:acyl-CoA dehydrogenase family protein [Actinacidiphila yeochonensis]|uniref:acyl-CoA dehydrogenase family protein n=1 Tax=Actinacidiphila yeochonensis TaxID=89050 RepID=UPI00099CA607|nr:acyl-CoA dehydrogenase family protein [Actinacidiphila yeochonensis]
MSLSPTYEKPVADVGPDADGPVPPPSSSWAEELAARLVRPGADDRDRESRWDAGLFAALAGDGSGPGLTGPLVPRLLGGSGLSATGTLALLEGLGQGGRDPGLSLAVAVHAVLATAPLLVFGSSGQRERYLPRMASGAWIGALSLLQTQGGASDPTVTARRQAAVPGGRVLDGELDMVAGAPVAHHFLVIATEEDGSRSAFLVDRATPGLMIGATTPAAMRTCSWGRLVLDNCPVPPQALLGTAGGAAVEVEPLLAALDWVFLSAPWLGLMRALAEDAAAAARTRRLFGSPLTHNQSARFLLADLATQCELAAGLLRRAAGQFDAGGRPSQQDAAAARLFVAAALRTVIEGAARITGPDALSGGHLVARAHRDALFFAETGGGPEVLRPVIAAPLLKLG